MKPTNAHKLILLSIMLFVTVITGCKKTSYYQLTDEEMLWLSYKNNEILRFSNGSISFWFIMLHLELVLMK